MPLVRISVLEGRSAVERSTIADSVHRALVDTMDVTEQDRFQIVEQHSGEGFIYARQYGSTTRSDALVIIQITLNRGRTPEMKMRFYDRVTALLGSAAGLRREDVFIGLVEVDPDNWFVP